MPAIFLIVGGVVVVLLSIYRYVEKGFYNRMTSI